MVFWPEQPAKNCGWPFRGPEVGIWEASGQASEIPVSENLAMAAAL